MAGAPDANRSMIGSSGTWANITAAISSITTAILKGSQETGAVPGFGLCELLFYETVVSTSHRLSRHANRHRIADNHPSDYKTRAEYERSEHQ